MEIEYAGKTHKQGKLPTNSHFRNQENNLLLYYIILWQCSDKNQKCLKTETLLNRSAHWLLQRVIHVLTFLSCFAVEYAELLIPHF